jgi:hypothetical protein
MHVVMIEEGGQRARAQAVTYYVLLLVASHDDEWRVREKERQHLRSHFFGSLPLIIPK